MQSAVTGLRNRHRSSSILVALVRITGSAAPLTSGARPDQSGRGYAQRPRELTEQNPRSRSVLLTAASATSAGPAGRHYSSSAEFSGGAFNVSRSASQSEHQQTDHADDDIDDKVLLLEASLKFVVSFSSSWLFAFLTTLFPKFQILLVPIIQGDKGWTNAALVSGAKHIGLSPAIIGLLPRGPAELVEASHFMHLPCVTAVNTKSFALCCS